ncbi:MAG TPA: aminotransferase class V-fold PLP-dependent enzyme [Candidatus Cybelea sp.]|nr:aminotransferase class V-fold PLP-dependent enzyme [Candidatus Cybelea sp.]
MSTPLARSEFEVVRQFVYLNHASAGVLPRASVAAIEAFVREHASGGVCGTYPYDLRLPEYREKIGRFIGTAGSQIALLTNTSAAAATVAAGLDWRPGDEVLLCDNEFPANAVPWNALRRRGVRVRLVPTAEGRLTPELLAQQLSAQTRLVALSWVSYADGYRHDLEPLASVAHQAGALLCVDAMQGLGAFPIDVGRTNVDALYAGGPKWLLALHGIALLYLSPHVSERLELALPGWRSMEDIWDFHNCEQPYARDAARFECGTPNLLGAISLVAAIELFQRSGPEAIAAHVLALTDRLCEGLAGLGAQLSTARGEGVSSGIVTFALPGLDSIELGRALERENIVTTYRTGGVRVSPHGYNTADEIDLLLERLANLASTKALV